MRVFILALISICFSGSFGGQDFLGTRHKRATCAQEFSFITPTHSACKDPSTQATPIPFTPEEQDVIIQQHIDYRAKENASAMMRPVWDDDIAYVAQKWADLCGEEGSHDGSLERLVPSLMGIYVGQNVAYGIGSHLTYEIATDLWYAEVKDFEHGTGAVPTGTEVIGHYTQVVLADVSKIGCGKTDCNGKMRIVCNYAKGQLTSQLPVPFDLCEDPSCKENCQTRDENQLCDCGGLMCLHQGTLDKTTCTCSCKPGFSGPSCEQADCANMAADVSYCAKNYCHWYSGICTRMCGVCGTACDTVTCDNGGTMNSYICKCTCPEGFSGDTCSVQVTTTATTSTTQSTTLSTTTPTTTTITDSTTPSTSTSTTATTSTPTTTTTTTTQTPDFTTDSTTPTTATTTQTTDSSTVSTTPTTATTTQTSTTASTTVSTTTPTTTSTTATTTTTTPSTTASSSCATAPEIPNSEVTVTDDVATYTCQEGTLPFGGVDSGDTSTCTDGVWSPTTLQCRDVSSCYQKSGRYAVYSGTQSTTNGGHTCQAWSDQSPIAHSHGSKDVHFNTVAGYTENPTVEAQSNFCRDPYGFGKPFCFTLTSGVRIDYCDEVIPQCECPDPPIVANAEVVVVGNKATYICIEGFVATSPTSSVSTCTNGLWSAVNIKCHDVSQCYVVSGGSRHYTGTHSTTRNGNTCQAWTEKTPHVHSYEAKHFIRVAGEDTTLAEHGNYCRDPSGYGRASLGSLWCFTTNPSKRREICSNVPRCVL